MGGPWAVHACPPGTDHCAQALSTLSSSQPPPVPPAADSAQQIWMDLEGSQCFNLFPLSNFRNPHLYYPIPLHGTN